METTIELTALQAYLIDAIDMDTETETAGTREKLIFLQNRFLSEYWHEYNKQHYVNRQNKAFASWLMGLPSATNTAFTNYDIINLGVLFDLLPANADDELTDKFVESWFDLCADGYLELFKLYGIN